MWNFSILRALGLMIRTAPFLLYRALVYLGLALAIAAMTAVGVAAGRSIGGLGAADVQLDGTLWGGLAGLAVAVGVLSLLRGRLLHSVKAGHVAVMADFLDGRPVPYGIGQVAHARAIVAERFGPTSALVALDGLVRRVIGLITGMVDGPMTQVPVPGLAQLLAAVRAWLRLSVAPVDEVILAHAARTRSENAWEAAHDALVLHAQNARPMVVGAAWITLAGWALTVAAFAALLGPASTLAALLPVEVAPPSHLLAAIFAWAVKAALIDPFALACLLQLFANLSAGQEPQPEWRGRLTQMSDRFRQLGERAVGWEPLADRVA